MEFVKKNYEKILLGLVLLGLAVAVAFLPFKISSENQRLLEMRNSGQLPVPALPELDVRPFEAVLDRVSTPAQVDFSEPHKVFNPMPWQLDADHRVIPGTKVGPNMVTVSNVSPLFLIINLDKMVPLAGSAPTYLIGVERQAAPLPSARGKRLVYCRPGDKKDIFTLLEAQGPPEDPSKLVIQLADGEKGEITKDNPFKRVEGYKATLRYGPEKRTWIDQRVDSVITFNFDSYKIVRIAPDEVVLSALSNQKKWTIKNNPAP